MGQYVLNTKSKKGSKDRTKEKLENRVRKKSRLGFLGFGPKADSALGSGKLILSAGKAESAFLGIEQMSTRLFVLIWPLSLCVSFELIALDSLTYSILFLEFQRTN